VSSIKTQEHFEGFLFYDKRKSATGIEIPVRIFAPSESKKTRKGFARLFFGMLFGKKRFLQFRLTFADANEGSLACGSKSSAFCLLAVKDLGGIAIPPAPFALQFLVFSSKITTDFNG
jgi:hypothetical protein